MTHFVGRVDWSFADTPIADSPTSHGLSRRVVVGREQAAVHTELALGAFAPGGWLQRHVHAFEEVLYVLEGEIALEIDGRVHHLVRGDYGLMPVGTWHALANAGQGPARFLGIGTPQRLDPSQGRRDTFFAAAPFDAPAHVARAAPPAFGSPTTRLVGHYDGTPPQAEALALPEQVRGRNPVGADGALLAYSGISVKMLVDRGFGADLLTVFTVDYEPRGAAQAHDHPFEECYLFLDGEVEAELDGIAYTLRAGDVVFAGVGSVHGFYNTGAGRVRWIETQAPQPPARHAYRWVQTWERFEASLGEEGHS